MKIYDRIVNKFWRTLILPKAKIRIGKTIFKVPRIQKNNFYKDNFQAEPWLNELLTHINEVKKIRTFIDIGVNIGQTLLKVKSINNNIQYVGFEPNPFCCSIVQQIITNNDFSRCSLVPCGLGSKNELLKLALASSDNMSDSSASVVEGFRKQEIDRYQFVSIFKLDDIIYNLEIEHIDLLKIDIEGAELEALQGMENVLNKYKPIIIIEVLPSYDASNEFRISRQKILAELLKEANYSIFHIKEKGKDIVIQEVNNFPIHKIVDESDYILLPANINVRDFKFKSI